jgi:hypothetical protein
VVRHETVDHGYFRAGIGKPVNEIAADEAESTGDDAPAPGNGVDR